MHSKLSPYWTLLLPVSLSLIALPALAQDPAPAPPAAATADDGSNPASPTSYHFVTDIMHGPSGNEAVVASKDADGKETCVIEVLTGGYVNGASVDAQGRAGVIADRLQSACNTEASEDKNFVDTLAPGRQNNQVVLVMTGSLVMTADDKSRKKAGFKSVSDYAIALLDNIKVALAPKLRDAKFDFQLGDPGSPQRVERANMYRLEADNAAAADKAHAIALYTQATRVEPDYATAYLALAHLYLADGNTDLATQVLKAGLKNGADLSGLFANNYADGATDAATQQLAAMVHHITA